MASFSHSLEGWAQLWLSTAGGNTPWLLVCQLSSALTSQSRGCTKPEGYKMVKPAGLAPCQYSEKELHPLRTCARCCLSFPCRTRFPGSAEPSQAPLSHPPTAHSMHHAQLRHLKQTSQSAELSGKKKTKPGNKKTNPKQQQQEKTQ